MDLGRGEAFIRTLNTRGAPTNAHYIEARRAELPTARFKANVRMTRSKFARRREDERNAAHGGGEACSYFAHNLSSASSVKLISLLPLESASIA